MKYLFLLTGLLLIIQFEQVISQDSPVKKHEFVYKTINGHDIKANIFLPASVERCPVIVYFHGGGFIFGNRDQGLNINFREKLLANHYAVVSADYRLAPETKLDEILIDVSDVVKWLKSQGHQKYNINPNKIAVAGGSAGGYLALSTGFDQKYAPDAIIAISTPTGFSNPNIKMGDLSILNQPGPYDIVKQSAVSYGDYDSRMDLWRFLARNRLVLYEVFGFDPSQEPEKLDRFKLSENINTHYPPILLVHAKNDHLVDLEQVDKFYQFLQEKEIASELYLVENGHSSELINQNPEALDKMVEFLKAQIK